MIGSKSNWKGLRSPEREDLPAHASLADERIVGWHGAVARQPQHLALEKTRVLSSGLVAGVSDPDMQRPVRAEAQDAAIVREEGTNAAERSRTSDPGPRCRPRAA